MTYAPVEAVTVPEAAGAPLAPAAGTLTGEPGLGGSLPDDAAAPASAAMAGEPDAPAAAGVGVAVMVE